MKKRKLVASLLALTLAASTILAGCGDDSNDSSTPSASTPSESTPSAGNDGNDNVDEPVDLLPYAAGTVLRMACGYNNDKTGMRFTADLAGEGITLADGKTYNSGDFKPTWQAVQEILGITIEDFYQGKSASNEYDYWDAQLDQIDMLSGTASKLSENGQKGKLVNIAQYLDQMPNFKAYLEANPIVRLSITGAAAGPNAGAIYFSPYFDGVDDIERMPLMRTDWVEKLLNGEEEFTAEAGSKNTASPVYQPYMPTSGKVVVDVVNAAGDALEKVTKDYDAYGNIVAKMNEAGSMDGVTAVNMLREYIDKTYNGYYGTDRANLFVGQNAAWDADELVALLRCVVANPQTLNGTDSVQGLFSRQDKDNQRRVDMFRFAGSLFGVRGLESRLDYLYVGNDGELHDARSEEAAYVAVSRMHDMVLEGLISKAFVNQEDVKTEDYLKDDSGFMHYDYNQTQTAYNATALQEGEKYMAVMVPVARWNDGNGEQFMRFTESWRSVKTDGWGISVDGVKGNDDKLNACLKLIDFAYSPEGQVLMSYGPDEFIKHDASGNIEYFTFNGEQWPVIADATYDELWSLANGNYTNYARQYIGSTLSFVKSQAFEYQCTHVVGKEGAGYISTAIALGTIKHPELELASNPWYTSVPTVLPQEVAETNAINELTELSASAGNFSSSNASDSNSGVNLFVDVICNGFTGEAGADAAATANKVLNDWGGSTYLARRNDAWHRLVSFYNSL